MKLELALPKTRYAVGEDVTATLVVENDTGAPVEVPDPFNVYNWEPKYTVVGPAHPGGFVFSLRSAVRKDPNPHPQGVVMALTTILPGARIEGEIPLQQAARLVEPGPYQLVARMAWEGAVTVSPLVQFYLEAPGIVSASLGVDVGTGNTREIWATWVRRSANGCELGDAMFLENRPDLGEVVRHMVSPVSTVGPTAAGALAPWTNYDRKAKLEFWRLWREGPELLALLAGEPKPVVANLGPMFAPIRPSLMTEDGRLHVFAFETAGRGLSYVRFEPRAAPHVARTEAVPGQIIGGGCALPARGQPGGPCCVVLADEGGALSVHVGTVDAAGAFGTFRGARLPRARAIPAMTPAVRLDADGGVHAVLLVRDAERPDEILRVDVRARGAGDVELGRAAVGRMAKEPRSARVVFSAWERPDPRVHWAVLLEDDSVIASALRDATRLGGTPVKPLEIVALSETAYVLVTEEASGVLLVALR
jgi:hypothetical protein